MSHVNLLVLGMLDLLGQGSGYDVVAGLDSLQISRWTTVMTGSIYHCLRQSAKSGFLEIAGTERLSGYPEKTIYRLTESGLYRLDRLQRAAFALGYPDFFGFKIALKLNKRIPPPELAAYAAEAMRGIDRIFGEMDDYLAGLAPDERERDAFFLEHDRLLLRAEREWLSKVKKLYDGQPR